MKSVRFGLSLLIGLTMIINTTHGQTMENQLIIQNKDIKSLKQQFFASNDDDKSIYTEIHMENNDIYWVDYDAYSDFDNLTHLYLSHNELESLTIYAPTLEYLDLSFNKIVEIESLFFDDYKELRDINLRGNQLVHIDWKLNLHENIKIIDISLNPLETVAFEASRLRALSLANNVHFNMALNIPSLDSLNLQFAKPNNDIGEFCHISNRLRITIVNPRGLAEFYNCQRINNIAASSDMVPMDDFVPKTNKAIQLTQKVVGCEFSTLKANLGDVILSSQEYAQLHLYFGILIIIIVILMISEVAMLCFYFRNMNQRGLSG